MLLDPLRISDDAWSHGEVLAALAARDIGGLFRWITSLTGASQSRIGAAVGLEQGYVSRIMAGRKVTSIEVLERIADGCRMPDHARTTLGLAPKQAVPPTDPGRRTPSEPPGIRTWQEDVHSAAELWRGDVNRRDVLRQVAFSSAGYTLPALRWFTAPDPAPVTQPGRSTVGQPEIDTIRAMTVTYRQLDNQYGGGHARDTVARYLHQEVTPLLTNGRYNHPTGQRLLSAAAELAQLAGWQAYDTAEHGIAQRYLTLALDFAHAAADDGLGAEILAAMSHQATYLGHTATGLDLARAARQTARRAGLLVLTAEAHVMEAHALAKANDGRACAAALHQAEQALDRADRSTDPQWLSYFDEAYLSAKFGHCFHTLGHNTHAERFAARSLRMDNRYVRGRAFNLALLASVHARQGEPERACTIGAEALTLTTQLRSARAVRYLRELQTHLAPHRRLPAVRHFTGRIDATLGPRR
ncbi:helix-turn-helix domain-containing protein [Micromonospora craniellae]|uniref:XRE family transcriptional regulator n=1 Tax=Micromonospora craniellae TaxID=2294034 RepID=A0A372G4B8_9ACTN|nr:helix-turn-helix domain-containing protein [Micromonospora craniellae]QOC94839.1 helix-turn-helix domain-containing protein [Micromonospora craniellae]RFS47619.1 XRE family transcriptional regulator [Micromonospora craniellae]